MHTLHAFVSIFVAGDPVETIYNVWHTCSQCKVNTDTSVRCARLNKGGKLYPLSCEDNTTHVLCEKDPFQEEFYIFGK